MAKLLLNGIYLMVGLITIYNCRMSSSTRESFTGLLNASNQTIPQAPAVKQVFFFYLVACLCS
jgi:hypothetical protein